MAKLETVIIARNGLLDMLRGLSRDQGLDARWDRLPYPIRDCERYLRSRAPNVGGGMG